MRKEKIIMKIHHNLIVTVLIFFITSISTTKTNNLTYIRKAFFLTAYNKEIFQKQTNSIITYKKVGSRFGDCIINYVKSKYFSHKYSLPFYYKPFKYSNLLTMNNLEKIFNDNIQKRFNNIIMLNNGKQINKTQNNTLYISHFYSETDDLYQYAIENPSFAAEIKKMLTPITTPHINLPTNIITVALHIRTGGGFDKPRASEQYYDLDYSSINFNMLETKPRKTYADYIWPTKFPPEQYYVDQLRTLSELLNNTPLYVYIFTDEQNTHALAERIKKATNKNNIIFNYRKTNNKHDLNVIEDFYTISKFDCLIRSSSLYTQAAELFGNHKFIIYPKKTGWLNNKLIIYETEIKIPDRKNKNLTVLKFNNKIPKEVLPNKDS